MYGAIELIRLPSFVEANAGNNFPPDRDPESNSITLGVFPSEMTARESDEHQSELGREASNSLGRFGHKLEMGACGK